MARGFSPRTTTDIQLMEQGVCNVVQGRTVNQRAAHVRRVVAAGLMIFAAVVVCAAVVGSGGSSSSSSTGKLAESQLYSATGWDAIYGGKGAARSSDGWGDDSGEDNTGARTNQDLHETDDSDSDSDSDDVDPDSAKGDVHWNAAGGSDSTSKTATSDDDSHDSSSDATSAKKAKSSGSSSKTAATQKKAKNGKPTPTDALLDLSKSFDKGMPTPKSRAEEKTQKAAQIANLLRIQKELSSDYKKVMAKGTGIKSVGKKMGLMKGKAEQTAKLGGDPFNV